MKYSNIVKGVFIKRPNRFIAQVLIDDVEHTVHVKNTGRCKELLIPGATVYLDYCPTPQRKTDYSLIGVEKGILMINMDSQVPNQVVYDGILSGKVSELPSVSLLKREQTYKSSRFDMYFEKDDIKGFIEVKGVTLENNGIACFPDAPTDRGKKHVLEMIDAVKEGYRGIIFFLIQMKGVKEFRPNYATDPAFANALRLASENGVEILAYDCDVSEDGIEIGDKVVMCYAHQTVNG